ncbi:MAG TPA: E3 binding domain-containing protein, partial [Deinococcales bacterium]|nr:E3 binding domain-containing protein [Deinococcales bacterium]
MMDEATISPLAKRLAEENSIDWRGIKGSGEGGRVIEKDILVYLSKIVRGEVDLPVNPDVSEPPPAFGDVNLAEAGQKLAREGVDLTSVLGENPTLPPEAARASLGASAERDLVPGMPDPNSSAILDTSDMNLVEGGQPPIHWDGLTGSEREKNPTVNDTVFEFNFDAPDPLAGPSPFETPAEPAAAYTSPPAPQAEPAPFEDADALLLEDEPAPPAPDLNGPEDLRASVEWTGERPAPFDLNLTASDTLTPEGDAEPAPVFPPSPMPEIEPAPRPEPEIVPLPQPEPEIAPAQPEPVPMPERAPGGEPFAPGDYPGRGETEVSRGETEVGRGEAEVSRGETEPAQVDLEPEWAAPALDARTVTPEPEADALDDFDFELDENDLDALFAEPEDAGAPPEAAPAPQADPTTEASAQPAEPPVEASAEIAALEPAEQPAEPVLELPAEPATPAVQAEPEIPAEPDAPAPVVPAAEFPEPVQPQPEPTPSLGVYATPGLDAAALFLGATAAHQLNDTPAREPGGTPARDLGATP